MAWLGICYEGYDEEFLSSAVARHQSWLKGERTPRMYGKNFIVIYDSNTAREFVKKIKKELHSGKMIVYTIPSVLMEIHK